MLCLSGNDFKDEGAKALASALQHGSFQRLEFVGVADNDIGPEGAEAFAVALDRSTLPLLQNVNLNGNHFMDDHVLRRVRSAVTGANCRGRMMLVLYAESDRCESPAKRFLARDGDHAVMCRIWKFMLS